jgi:long-chain acyl-CoA synthetase
MRNVDSPSPPFRDLPSLVAEHAQARPQATALVVGDRRLSYAELDALADRVAALDQGQLLACDHPAAIRANPRVQAAYLNALPVNPAKGRSC